VRVDTRVISKSLPAQSALLTTRVDVTAYDPRLPMSGNLGTLSFRAIGAHNVRNALAACAVGLCLGMRFREIADGIKLYDGVQRRLQLRGEERGIKIIEDYAHHPTEIASTAEAVRWINPTRIIGVFQPHLYSRTKFFYADFARVLGELDHAIVTSIYGSREAPVPGVNSGLIVDAARQAGANRVELVNDMNDVPARLAPDLRAGDVVLVMGAGNINRIVPALLEAIRSAS
jgi:UDP-N-acetylmuramate--alanine ligase